MKSRQFRYNAFISYSQRDRSTVAWLRRVLSDYWVPGRKRRSIFLDRMSMGAGVLDDGLVNALRDSKFLIVCCSSNARESEWVDKEVEEFLKTHTDREVLVCAVGPTNEIVFPRSIENLQQRRGRLRWPDLRGFPESIPRREQQDAISEALSLLAELLGFAGKDALVDIVGRWRARRFRIAAATVALFIIAAAATWGWLYHTTSGAFFLARQRVLHAAATEIHDDPYLATTAYAFGVMGRRRDIERLAETVKDREFRGLVLAAGFAALPDPDCARSHIALEPISRPAALMEPRSFLLHQERCGGTWAERAKPEPLEGDALLRWGRALAQTGFGERARTILERPDFPAKDRLPLAAAIAIATRSEFALTDAEIAAWSGDRDAANRLWAAVQELRVLDLGGRLTDSGSLRLLAHAKESLADLHASGFGNWNHQQRLAAHAAGTGDPAAESLLGPLPEWALNSPSEAPGLAWRALALHRLGRVAESKEAFDYAEVAASTLTPQTRSWREWFDIATAASLADEWRRAFRAAESPGNEPTRFDLRRHVIELWAHRDAPESRW